jgi:uncharacterized membrane protein YecN with MAPEG domain
MQELLMPYHSLLAACTALVGLVLVQVLVADFAGIRAKHVPGMPIADGHKSFLFRATRAHGNTVENLALFVMTVLLAVGLVFQLPIFILSLVRLGVLETSTLRRNRRLGYFIVAVVAVLLPGIDPVTTTFEMVPLIALYEASIWLSVLVERRVPRPEVASLTDP